MQLLPTALAAMPRTLPAEELPIGKLITVLIIAAALVTITFLVRKKFFKIIFISSAEICLFLACKAAFGPDSIITQIMCWITAAVVCMMTLSIVNNINWSNLRGRPGR